MHSSYIHVVSKHDCAAFLLSIRWLRSLISRQNQLEKVLSHSRIQSHSVQSPAPVSRTTTALSGRNARGHITQSPLMKAYNLNFSDEQSRELGIEQGDDERVGIDIVSEQRRLELSYVDEAEEFEFDEQFQFEDSRIISVFCPTQELTTTNTNTVTNTVGNTVANKVMLTGSQIIYDTMMGHVAIFQTSNGMIASINLTSHIQFCESQLSFQEKLGLIHPSSHVRSLYNTSPNPNLNPNFQSSTGGSCGGGSNGSLELKIAQKQQYAHEESLTKLFQQAIQGLSRVPVSSSAVQLKIEKNKSQLDPSTTTANSTTAAADSDMNAYDVLLTAKTHFDKEVSLPLQEIAHRLKYRVESLHDLYSIQTKLLSGSTPVSSVGATSTSTTASMNNRTEDDDRKKLYQQGLTVQVDRLKREHENTLIRVGKIQEVYTEQIKRAELLLQAVSFLRGKVTPAEREHYQRLIRWSESATVLENKLESLSQLQARVMAQVVSSTTPTVIETVPSVDATATSTVESKIEPVESVDKAVNALTMQLSDDLILSTPSKPDIISSTTSTIPLSARNVSGSKPYIFTSPIITKSGFKSTIYSTPLTTQKQRSVTDSTADMKLTTPLSVIASKPSYVSAYGTPTTFLNQRRGITVGKVNSSEVKNSQCKSPVTPQLIGEGLSESELEQCIKMQGVQTEMLHASVAELKQLEAKLKLLM